MLPRMIPALGLSALLILLASPGPRASAQDHPVAEKSAEKHDTPPAAAEAHGASPAAAHAAEANPDIKKPEPNLAIWTLIVFLGLMLVLGKFAWKPLMKALHERESHLEQVLLDSEKARNDAESLAAQHRKELSLAADQVRALIEEARKEAQAAANTIIQKAQAEAESSRQRAEREISGAKDQALMEIWSQTADLAVSVAGKVLGKELGESDHKRLVEMAMGELPAQANGRDGGRA